MSEELQQVTSWAEEVLLAFPAWLTLYRTQMRWYKKVPLALLGGNSNPTLEPNLISEVNQRETAF